MGSRDVYTADLGPDGLEFYTRVTAENELSEGEKALLAQAAGVIDLIALLGETLTEFTTKGSTGQLVIHPVLTALTDQRRLLATLLSALELPVASEDAPDSEVADIDYFRRRRGGGSA